MYFTLSRAFYFRTVVLGILLFCAVGKGYGQEVCRPVSEKHSNGGLCIGTSVNNGPLAFDNDPNLNTSAALKNNVGLGCYVEMTMTFGGTAIQGDSIQIFFGTGGGLLDVGLLGNVSAQLKNNNVNVGSALVFNDPLLKLSILSNEKIGYVQIPIPNAKEANQVQVKVGGLLSLLVELKIYDVRLKFARPTITGGTDKEICEGQTATISTIPANGTTLKWYESATNFDLLYTGNVFVTPNLTTSKIYYLGISRFSGCEDPERIPITVSVHPKPDTPEIHSQ